MVRLVIAVFVEVINLADTLPSNPVNSTTSKTRTTNVFWLLERLPCRMMSPVLVGKSFGMNGLRIARFRILHVKEGSVPIEVELILAPDSDTTVVGSGGGCC